MRQATRLPQFGDPDASACPQRVSIWCGPELAFSRLRRTNRPGVSPWLLAGKRVLARVLVLVRCCLLAQAYGTRRHGGQGSTRPGHARAHANERLLRLSIHPSPTHTRSKRTIVPARRRDLSHGVQVLGEVEDRRLDPLLHMVVVGTAVSNPHNVSLTRTHGPETHLPEHTQEATKIPPWPARLPECRRNRRPEAARHVTTAAHIPLSHAGSSSLALAPLSPPSHASCA